MSLEEKDFSDCLEFFARPLPELLSGLVAGSLGEARADPKESLGRRAERAAVVLELTGTECIKEVIFGQREKVVAGTRRRGPPRPQPSPPPSSGAVVPMDVTTCG
nr:protein UL91 [Equid gammaherpesvirus 5]UTK45603.1 protein UL91 [Equid gammaherpesvirus 5]UTK45682.1 protein UL91 [Equid gammaherpesvirus 5]UTK45760.1 protein UL91 [Equid gammaherpesvirus 5]